MKTKIDYDLLNREMLDDIQWMIKKRVDIDQLEERTKSNLYHHLLKIYYILDDNKLKE